MGRAVRRNRASTRTSERVALYARLQVTSVDGKLLAPLSTCTNIGIGGLRGSAGQGISPGTRVIVAVELPSGRVFEGSGHVAWSKLTLHPALFGTPRGRDDDALFGIAFDDLSPDELLPIARLLVAREAERRRARNLRRRTGLPIHA
jgi:hypothetical protein